MSEARSGIVGAARRPLSCQRLPPETIAISAPNQVRLHQAGDRRFVAVTLGGSRAYTVLRAESGGNFEAVRGQAADSRFMTDQCWRRCF
jgi:hypothetical protein